MIKVKFMRCTHCGNIIEVVHDGGVTPDCCGQPMDILVANSTDAAGEKHVPVIERDGDTVTIKIGSVAHPMLEEHYIEWVAVAHGNRIQRACLKPGETPEATFTVPAADAIAAYEYCNLHGLWTAQG